jgi:hypothetical protein
MALSDKDVNDTMAADWAEIQSRYRVEDDAPAGETAPAAGDVEVDPPKEVIPVSRKPDGKFKAQDKDTVDPKAAKVDKATPAAAKPLTSAPSKEDAGAATAEPPAGEHPERDLNRAPSSFRPLARTEWDKVPASIRAEIYRREQDFLNGRDQLLPDAQLGKGLRQVIDPYMGMIQAEGGTPELAVADLFRTAAILRTGSQAQKLQVIATVADQFRVDLTPLFNAIQQRNGQQPTGQPQPNGQPAQPAQFRDPRVDQLLAQQQRERQEAANRETQTMEATVTRWMNEMDAQGQPKRPYLNDVINEVSALIPAIRQADPTLTHAQALDAAYDRAIWAHPEIRTLLAQKQQTDLDAQRRAENQRQVRDARRAGSVNVPRRASQPSPGKPGKMEDTIADKARELGLITT